MGDAFSTADDSSDVRPTFRNQSKDCIPTMASTPPAAPGTSTPGTSTPGESTSGASIDPRALRTALGAYGTGVAIVTALDAGGQPVGMTINSLAAVSLDPPLVLWSVQLDTPSASAFRQARHFALSILAADQETIARQFARTDSDKFSGIATTPGSADVPLIDGAVVHFECEAWACYPGGDHEIIVGKVTRLASRPGPTLGFHRGRFTTLADA